ncbi:hypothetical protein GLAREA_00479 [Glarea lozoyensis ATCC 20868]|uniref:Uncharacterized protein n=1 Tax=Glarea lozoyensis (strain ATCC 20868 / MF5171) TaxID=1116229 RepID=S3CWL4_GLAL2|nr:uncharacterized protein GLAREA_00479 [Glarea lozoyensis ATCC 20868]EPE29319.1 hypothetical protein GLAREA_00479 [Glarea lozoyensis ATCC 20868]
MAGELYQLIEDEDKESPAWLKAHRSQLARMWTFFLGALILSIVANLIQVSQYRKMKIKCAELRRSTKLTFQGNTEYSSANETRADGLWDDISTGIGAITLTKQFAESHGLLDASPFPWANNQGVYFVQGFHEMHCLKTIRKSLAQHTHNIPQSRSASHIAHCFDVLRQSILCAVNDTPMPVIAGRVTGDGQVMKCRNWKQLEEWVSEPERSACYRFVDEYREVPINGSLIERYAFCGNDSLYFDTMKRFFEMWGHQSLFG